MGPDKMTDIMRLLKEDADTNGGSENQVEYTDEVITDLIDKVPYLRASYNKIKNTPGSEGYPRNIVEYEPMLETLSQSWLVIFSVSFPDGIMFYSGMKYGFIFNSDHCRRNDISKTKQYTLQAFMKGYAYWNISKLKRPNLLESANLAKTTPGRLLRYLAEYIVTFSNSPI